MGPMSEAFSDVSLGSPDEDHVHPGAEVEVDVRFERLGRSADA
jgi:hypothetical protein